MLVGILFTILWASASIAIKFGLLSAAPLTLATIRFLIAGSLLLLYIYLFQKGKYPIPQKGEWKSLFLIGLLNTSLYLGLGFWALQTISAAIFNLFVVVNPFLVALLSSLFLGRSIQLKEWMGMGFSAVGLVIATYPLLEHSRSTMSGVFFLACGMVSMAIGSVYFQKVKLHLPNLVINGWQVLIGGILLMPASILLEYGEPLKIDAYFILYLVWSVFGVSICAMLLWFYLLKQDAVKANNWLFLTPIAGYGLSAILLGEAITMYDVTATLFVFFGLYLSGNFRLNRFPKHTLSKNRVELEE